MSYEWVNKKAGGLGTKASVNWGDQRMNWGLRTKTSDVVFCLPKYINNKINHSQ